MTSNYFATPAPRYRIPLYLGDQHSRKVAADKLTRVEIEVLRDIEQDRATPRRGNVGKTETEAVGRGIVKRAGILNRAIGNTIWVDTTCYHMDEIIRYRELPAK